MFGYVTTQSFLARCWPNILDIIKRFERRGILGKSKPRQFAPGEDVNIRLDRFWIIKRSTRTNKVSPGAA
jgi:hypothetical protein